METLQQCLTQTSPVWYQTNSNELVSFGIFFIAMWLIAIVIDATLQKIQQEG